MVRNSLQNLLGMFPYFMDRSIDSNFYKSQYVSNKRFQEIYQHLEEVIESFNLKKRCLIWKEQNVPYLYTIHFVANYPHLKNVNIFKNGTLIYFEEYDYEDNVDSFFYNYEGSTLNNTNDDLLLTDDEETDAEYDENALIVPDDTFSILVETYDEYIFEKGFPENDTILNDIYDHDVSLDEIGALNNIPRKEYIQVADELLGATEPPFNDRLTEDDFHYMNRILEYNLRLHNTPLPVLEIWKLYGIDSTLLNRERFLGKAFDETKHSFDSETGLVGDWYPNAWEHKDTFCDYGNNLGEYFFVKASSLIPVRNQNVMLRFSFLNSLAQELTGEYLISIYSDDVVIVEDYIGSQYTLNSSLFVNEVNNFLVTCKRSDGVEIGRELVTITIRGCATASYYVSTTGDDSNDGKTMNTAFATIGKATSKVHGDKNLIAIINGEYTINSPVSIYEDCTIIGCTNVTIENTSNNRLFKVPVNHSLILQDLNLKFDNVTHTVDTLTVSNNNPNNEPSWVTVKDTTIISLIKTILTLNTNKNTYTYGDTINITGTLTDENENNLSGKTIKIYMNNQLIDTVTTNTNGAYSTSTTANISGNVQIKAVFESDDTYYTSSSTLNITVNRKTSTISLSSSSASVPVNDSYTLSGTLSAGIGLSVKIYDGTTLIDTLTTGSNGTFSKTLTSSTTGTHNYTAVFDGNEEYANITSSVVNVTITKRTPTISLLSSSTSVVVGNDYTLSGALLDDGTGIGNAAIKLYQGTTLIDTLTTANDGTFSKTVTSSSVGTFTYHVVFDTTSVYSSVTSSNVTVIVSEVTPSFDGISLTSDKDILSAYDEESATLTAQLLDGTSPAQVPGETVTFEVRKSSDDSLVETLTDVTDASGIATVSYLGKGTGDLYIQSFSTDRIISSGTYAIEDCTYYHESAFTSTQSDFNVNLPSDFEITFYTYRNSSSSNSAYLECGGDSGNTALCGQVGSGGESRTRIYRSEGSSTYDEHSSSSASLRTLTLHTWIQNGTSNSYATQSVTPTTWTDNVNHPKIRKISITNNRIEQLKVKPL